MAYSPDLRKRVLDFIETVGKKSEAARRFTVARATLYRWLVGLFSFPIILNFCSRLPAVGAISESRLFG